MALCCPALPQQRVAPPPKPADSGPTLAATMQFIQDKMNNQGPVGYVYTGSNPQGVTYRNFLTISDAQADPQGCTLKTTRTLSLLIEVPNGATYSEDGLALTGDDLKRRAVYTSTISFKDAEKITVENLQDSMNRFTAQHAHPEITFAVAPAVYQLELKASQPKFAYRVSSTRGKAAPQEKGESIDVSDYLFRDEDTANRVAKAMLHAVELCGGGNKDPF